jgi:hypothetical protein
VPARSPEGARELALEHVLASFHILETILEQAASRLGRTRAAVVALEYRPHR